MHESRRRKILPRLDVSRSGAHLLLCHFLARWRLHLRRLHLGGLHGYPREAQNDACHHPRLLQRRAQVTLAHVSIDECEFNEARCLATPPHPLPPSELPQSLEFRIKEPADQCLYPPYRTTFLTPRFCGLPLTPSSARDCSLLACKGEMGDRLFVGGGDGTIAIFEVCSWHRWGRRVGGGKRRCEGRVEEKRVEG